MASRKLDNCSKKMFGKQYDELGEAAQEAVDCRYYEETRREILDTKYEISGWSIDAVYREIYKITRPDADETCTMAPEDDRVIKEVDVVAILDKYIREPMNRKLEWIENKEENPRLLQRIKDFFVFARRPEFDIDAAFDGEGDSND